MSAIERGFVSPCGRFYIVKRNDRWLLYRAGADLGETPCGLGVVEASAKAPLGEFGTMKEAIAASARAKE